MHLLEHTIAQYGSISETHLGNMSHPIMDPSTPTLFLHSTTAMPASSFSGVRLSNTYNGGLAHLECSYGRKRSKKQIMEK